MKSKVTYHIEAFRSIEHSYTHLENIVTEKNDKQPTPKNLQIFFLCVYMY